MNGRRFKFVAAISALLIGSLALASEIEKSPAAQKRVQYELKLVKGRSYDARVISDSNVVQESKGQEARSHVSLGLGYRLDVVDADANGNSTALCTVTWVKFSQKSPTTEMIYDSADENHPIPSEARAFGPAGLLGEKFTVVISRQGQVQEIQGLEAVRQNIGNKLPEGPDRQQAMEGITEQQLAASIREYFLRPLAIYPSVPVRIGDSWNRRDASGTAPYDYATSWTLKSRKEGVAVIDANTIMTPKSPFEQGGAAISGRSGGQIEIDESTGRILRSRIAQTLSGQVTAGSSGVGVKTDSVTTFELIERKDGAAL
jgi:hypothetical protein